MDSMNGNVAPRTSESRELDYGNTDTWDDLRPRIMYGIMEDAQDDRSQLRGRVNLLYRDRPCSLRRQRGDFQSLLSSYHKRQVQFTKTLRLLKGLQTQMVEFQRQHRPAKGPAQPDAPGEAGSSS
ncbi:hypothetical protein Tco_1311810 [Tanacetum coccineum]